MIPIDLPAFLDPFLGYLLDTLPAPLYSFIIELLSYCLALLAAVISLIQSLASKNPLQWDAQSVLPPLISILAAYLALVSLYRTTSWFLRTSVWFLKWGTIFGALLAGAGWYAGNNAQGNAIGAHGVASTVGGWILEALNSNGANQNAAARRHRNSRSTPRSRQKKSTAQRPKPWNSFNEHANWQNQEDPSDADKTFEKVINGIVDSGDWVFGDRKWWEMARSYVAPQITRDNTESSRDRNRKGRSSDSSSRSR